MRDQPSDLTIRSPAEFNAALATVVEAALEGGVDTRGAWEFETALSPHEWEVQVYELARDGGDGEL